MRSTAIIVFLILINLITYAQDGQYEEILLNNPAVRIQATEAVNLMYNFKFEEAELRFKWIRSEHPDHPLYYFMMGLANWWKIMPNVDNEEYDEEFLSYMDSAIVLAETMGGSKRAEYAEKAFFLAGAHAFKARLFSERADWRKASFSSKKALNYLEESRDYKEWSPEFLFGEGVYNYYVEWVKENYKYLRPILLFFPSGDKELGMKQLEENAQNSYYTRTEGQYWLMRMYYYEDEDQKAYELGKYLHETFPDNPYFHRYYARLCFSNGKLKNSMRESKEIIRKIEAKMPGYEGISGRYASFFLGYIHRNGDKNIPAAKKYFKMCIDFSEDTDSEDAGYYLHSYANLAQIAEEEGDQAVAIEYYKKLLSLTEKKSSLHKEAVKYLKSKDAYDEGWWPF